MKFLLLLLFLLFSVPLYAQTNAPDDQKNPVIVVSAYGTLMNAQDAHQAAGVIQKPFDYDDLVGQVSRATARDYAVALT